MPPCPCRVPRVGGVGLEVLVQPFAALGEAVLQHDLRVGAGCGAVQFRGVDGNGVFDLFEQALVIRDIAEILVVTIEAVRPADGLEEAVVLHGFVDVEEGAGRGIEAGK